jgi:hypothetical protein
MMEDKKKVEFRTGFAKPQPGGISIELIEPRVGRPRFQEGRNADG